MFKGEDIKKKRKDLKLSAKKLAALIQVDEGNIYKWEKGHKPHDPEDFLKIQAWLSEKTETVTNSKNGAVVPNKPQGSHNSEKQLLDLIKEINQLREQQIETEAKFIVIFSELAHLMAKGSGQSHASAALQLKKDVSIGTANLKTLE